MWITVKRREYMAAIRAAENIDTELRENRAMLHAFAHETLRSRSHRTLATAKGFARASGQGGHINAVEGALHGGQSLIGVSWRRN
jgi:hypothetical protein